jgi:hypothetical protein
MTDPEQRKKKGKHFLTNAVCHKAPLEVSGTFYSHLAVTGSPVVIVECDRRRFSAYICLNILTLRTIMAIGQ